MRFYLHHRGGRPLLDVNMEQVRDIRTLGFKWTQISTMLNVSRQTLYRRLEGIDLLTFLSKN